MTIPTDPNATAEPSGDSGGMTSEAGVVAPRVPATFRGPLDANSYVEWTLGRRPRLIRTGR